MFKKKEKFNKLLTFLECMVHFLHMGLPLYKAPLTKGHASYQAIFQMHWDGKILLNCHPQDRPLRRPTFHCRMGDLIRRVLLYTQVQQWQDSNVFLYSRFHNWPDCLSYDSLQEKNVAIFKAKTIYIQNSKLCKKYK